MNSSMQVVLDHFGLAKRPFSLVPDPAFVVWSENNRRAQTALNYGIMSNAPITMITGDVGAGKTTILRHLLSHPDENLKFGLIANATPADRVEMLRLVLISLGENVPETDSYATIYAQLEAHLIEEYSAGHRVVLVFDEAQNLDRDSLEHLRMLTNINFGEHELVQMVLIGQPELRDMVARPDLRQLAQRISANAYLPPLSRDEVENYVVTRLAVAGRTEPLFEPDTFEFIHECTNGVPRLINQLCDYGLLYAYGEGQERVTRSHLEAVVNENFLVGLEATGQLRAVP